MKITILCSDDAHHRYLISTLQRSFNVAAVVIEPAAFQRKRLLRNKKYRDYIYSQYHRIRRICLGLDAYRRKYFALDGPLPKQPSYKVLVTESINDPKVVELLKKTGSDVTIVMGTGILGQRILDSAGPITLNIHGGYLPDYRGNHCFFFAVYDGRFDRIGSTIHFINAGIDTGELVEVVVPPIYPNDSVEALYSRAEKLAVERLVGWLKWYEGGGAIPRRKQPYKGKLYRTKDRKPHHDIVLALRRLSGRLVLPMRLPADAVEQRD
jgi:methionyl-tRNA formyltransferase